VGSNNWVVDGRHSKTGKPLLANDPHLKLSAPALWYYARIDIPGLQLAGATMPGLPLVVLGQNQHIAWGFTNTNPDVQDLYLERLHPDDAGVYETPQGWARFDEQLETIQVRGAADVRIKVRTTRHGPVISDANSPATQGLTGAHNPIGVESPPPEPAASASAASAPDGPARMPPRYVIALQWTALDPDVTPIDAGLAFNRARTVAEFINASADSLAPMQNMVVADAEGSNGHIAFVAAGRVPIRRADNDLRGLVPAPGWDARYDWQAFLDPTLTPRERDPQRGWIATANQRIHAPDYPHYLGSEWAPPYRAQRIEQLLAAQPRHDLESFAAIQGDVVSLGAQRLLPFFRRALSEHPLAGRLAGQISTFDGVMAAGRSAPLIYHAWARHLTQLVFADKLGPLWQREFGDRRSFREGLEGVMERQDAWWCDNRLTRDIETCNDLANEALNRALSELQARLGDDPGRWRWGDVHQARAEHRPFSKVGALSWLFELRTPVGGDGYTVNVSRVGLKADATTGELYLSEHGPSLRALYDVADPGKSRFIYSSGQSGIALSSLYRRFLARWAGNTTLPLWPAPGSSSEVLTLVPAQP
jgi:penicillin amidase